MVLVMSLLSISRIKAAFDFDTRRFFLTFYSMAKLGQQFVLATKHAEKIYYISNLLKHPTSVYLFQKIFWTMLTHCLAYSYPYKNGLIKNKKAYFCGHRWMVNLLGFSQNMLSRDCKWRRNRLTGGQKRSWTSSGLEFWFCSLLSCMIYVSKVSYVCFPFLIYMTCRIISQ